jgi:hypothetical protein
MAIELTARSSAWMEFVSEGSQVSADAREENGSPATNPKTTRVAKTQ